MNHTEQTKAEEMLLPECLEIYQAQLHDVWHRFIWIRESMQVISSITNYPLAKFVAPDEVATFWNLLVNNCGDAVIPNRYLPVAIAGIS